nr:hypothetical protein [Kosakonia sp. MUSA4]
MSNSSSNPSLAVSSLPGFSHPLRPGDSNKMKAIRYHAFGGPDALKVEDITDPHPGPGEIRITVHCAGVNPSDWKRREGQYQAFEDISFPLTVGVEASGIRAHYLQ